MDSKTSSMNDIEGQGLYIDKLLREREGVRLIERQEKVNRHRHMFQGAETN